MSSHEEREILARLGEPHIGIEGLRIWIHGREFPDEDDYWDGNWLVVTAHCRALEVETVVDGPVLHVSELVDWLAGCESMQGEQTGEASLDCMEPYLTVRLHRPGPGSIRVAVDMMPVQATEGHHFDFELDPARLPELIRQLQQVLARYPRRGAD